MIMDNAYRNINVIVTVWCELKIRSLTRAAQIFLLPLAVARASLCIHTHLLRYRYARASLLNLYTRGSDFFYYRLLSRMLLCVFIRTCSAIASRVLLCLYITTFAQWYLDSTKYCRFLVVPATLQNQDDRMGPVRKCRHIFFVFYTRKLPSKVRPLPHHFVHQNSQQ